MDQDSYHHQYQQSEFLSCIVVGIVVINDALYMLTLELEWKYTHRSVAYFNPESCI